MDKLVQNGINLNQHYTFKFCSPTRSSIQSGRNPIHVNVQNVAPDLRNPADPVAGYSAIARNMTGMAVHMRAAGYATAAVGKWDAGMATLDHTPKGRGYDQSLIYFHHANDYWQYTAGTCAPAATGLTDQDQLELNLPPRTAGYPTTDPADLAAGPAPPWPSCPARFTVVPDTGLCMSPSHVIWHGPVSDTAACCAKCAATAGCVGWTHQNGTMAAALGTSPCFICNVTKGGPNPGRTSGCVGDACDYTSAITDLWSGSGPAHALKPALSCVQQNDTAPWPANASCLYEDALFEAEVHRIIAGHPLPQPLMLFWAPHIVHGPDQLPETAFDAMDFITDDANHHRQNYLGRVRYIDASFGRLMTQLEQRGMYENAVIVMHADNGGPLGSANNFPLKGGKHSNWQGGVRVNAFISGGALPIAVRGTTSDELITAWDWYATFVHGIAGADPTDHRAAAAGLPPIDSIDHWDYLTGKTTTSPRNTIPLGSCSAAPDEDPFCQTKGNMPATVNGVVSYLGAGTVRRLWKLLIGRIPLAGWTGPKYPNGTAAVTPTVDCGAGCLYDLQADPTEHFDLGADPAHSAVKTELYTMIRQHNATTFTPDRGAVDPAACTAAREKYDGFCGPWVE